MIVTLMYKETTNTIILPDKKEGQFWIGTKNKKEIISVEGSQNKWILKSNKKVKILDKDKKQLKTIELEENSITALDIEGRIALIFTEPLTSDRQIFTKKIVDKELSITIGRSEENAICFNNNFVSSIHARLIYHNKYWLIKDNNSINGVYVNGKKERTKDLEFGDVIYIMGLKIIVFYDFIMINNPDNLVTLKDELFKNPLKQSLEILNDEDEEVEDDEIQREYFYRSPRFKRDIEKVDLKIDEPPSIANGERLPTALTLGPAITMGLASLTTAIFSINTAITSGDFERYVPTMAMSISMLLGTLLWPTVTKVYEKIMIKRKEKLRQEKYTEYLKSIENKLKQEKQKQEKILKENFVTIDECEERILSTKRNLWERGLWQDDFLKIRLGTGDIPLDINLIYNERKFLLNEDPLLEKMYEICEKPTILENVPITVSLYEEYICGVIGDQNKRNEFAKGMIFQLASLYSYDEVKMIFLYNESDKDDFHFVKWLPHTFSNDKSFRFIATNLDELKEISYYLDEEIANRSQLNETEIEDALPYYVIFALDKNLALKSELLTQIYSKKQNLNFSVINFCEQLQELPKECSTVIELYQRDAKIYDKDDMSGNYTTFKPDIYLTADPNKLSKKLANTLLNTLESEYKLPTLINFLQMFQVGKIEHLNVLSRWQENDPTKSLATPIGIDTYGELFKLDLHEKFHGPHGLIAGMTGSGKSEFIITYILSLAVNYHPNEVAFILIDYKGGGMAKAFEKLPHVSGIITNLDGASINRALISIDSELKRRQKIFDETSKKIQVSNIDIYKYQRLYREKRVDQPMPHLFIISDEFAELKSQQPEFMTQLISTARIGRSLGVHLILATQKPNGVVNDQIWSNSKFKICLKVQEKADSMDMIKRPDAAMLKETGRFYLQVGYNELFELGQSAWAGAQYYPTDKYIKEKDDSVVIIDNNARVLKDIKINKNKYKKNTPKQLDAITEYLYNISVNENINAKPIWLEPINPNIILEEIQNKYKIQEQDFYINPVIGEYDDPINQRQCYLRIPISENGNVLIYGSLGSGKNMLLTTMIYSIITKYSPEEVNLYLLDFETETLNAFEEAPHIGDVILSNDNEKITNLLKTLYKEIEIRKKNFTNFGGTYLRYIEESEKKLPNIIVIISNYAAFSEMYPDKEEALNYLTREGSKYGIYFVVTANSTNAMKLYHYNLMMKQYIQ